MFHWLNKYENILFKVFINHVVCGVVHRYQLQFTILIVQTSCRTLSKATYYIAQTIALYSCFALVRSSRIHLCLRCLADTLLNCHFDITLNEPYTKFDTFFLYS